MSNHIHSSGVASQITQNTDIQKLAIGASTTLIGKVGGRGIHVISQILLARFLGPEAFGLYAIGWSVLRIVGGLTPLGLDKGVLHFGPRYQQDDLSQLNRLLSLSIWLALLSGLAMGGLLFFSADWLAIQVFKKPGLVTILRWIAFIIPLVGGLRVAEATTRLSHQMKFSIYAEQIGQPTVNFVLIIFFLWTGLKVTGAMLALAISFGFGMILALYYIKYLYPQTFGFAPMQSFMAKKILKYSLPASFAGIFSMFIVWVDRLMVGYFLSSEAVGIYQAISQTTILFATVLGSFGAIFGPMITELYHQKEIRRLNDVYRISTKWGLYVCIPIALVIVFAPREFLSVIFGAEYVSGWLPLVILTVGQIINVVTGAVGLLLILTNRHRQWFVISFSGLLLNIVLGWILIPQWGIVGAAFGTAFSISVIFIMGLIQVRFSLKLWPYNKQYLIVIFASGVSASFLFLLQNISFDNSLIQLLTTSLISLGVFTLILSLSGLANEDKLFIRLIQTRLRSSK